MSSDTTGATGLAGRYATALYELAAGANALDEVAGDLDLLAAMNDESDDFRRLIRSPVISRTEQGAAMAALMERTEATDLARKFVGLLAANRRLFVLPQIIQAYHGLLARQRDEKTAEITSAALLSESQRASLEAALQKSVGGSVTLRTHVDKTLLGGLVIRLGSSMIDSSLQTKLEHLKLAMRGTG
ncbi:MAG: F0F1 ATP synthase subunit delta [Rhodospirillales bacterium]|nr:F0F1 ATP synthase subunit delta [Rhodospirillales bacterium]